MNVKRFAGLDGLRFISISFVILHHLFTFKSDFGLTAYDYPVLGLIGLYGIHFFFMGSGFLITYMLLAEHEHNKSISLKNFFIRRTLRIWPAYYLLILLALLVVLKLPFFRIPGLTDQYLSSNYKRGNMLYLFFLPHIVPFFNPTAPYVHHTYTIGIEEQFYFLWGILFYYFYRYMYWIFIAILIAMPLLNLLHDYLYAYIQSNPDTSHFSFNIINKGITYLKYSRFSTFAIGSLFGYSYFYKKKWIFYFRLKSVQVLVYTIFVLSILLQIEVPFIQFEYMASIMGCIMLMATFKKESIVNYSAKWIEYLGKISYGIYLFHIFAIVFAVKIFINVFHFSGNDLWQILLLCLLTLILSVFFGWLSYNYFERFFLKLKQRYRKV